MGRGQQGSAPAPRSAWVPANPVDLDRGRAGRRSVAVRLADVSGMRRPLHGWRATRGQGCQLVFDVRQNRALYARFAGRTVTLEIRRFALQRGHPGKLDVFEPSRSRLSTLPRREPARR